jgi:hypothetical protein
MPGMSSMKVSAQLNHSMSFYTNGSKQPSTRTAATAAVSSTQLLAKPTSPSRSQLPPPPTHPSSSTTTTTTSNPPVPSQQALRRLSSLFSHMVPKLMVLVCRLISSLEVPLARARRLPTWLHSRLLVSRLPIPSLTFV